MWNNMNSNEWSNTVFVKNNNDGAKLVRYNDFTKIEEKKILQI